MGVRRRRLSRIVAALALLVGPLGWTPVRAGTVLTFAPTADAFVRADQPGRNFGATSRLVVDHSPLKDVLLRFHVTGVGSAVVEQATLRLFVSDGSPSGGNLLPVADTTWGERTVTWNTAPAPASTQPIASLGAVTASTWASLDVTSVIGGDGSFSFRLVSPSANSATYPSREGAVGSRPQLVLSLAGQDTTAPAVSLTSPADGATVAGMVPLVAGASDDVGVTRVNFLLDGTPAASDTTAPYGWQWDTTGVTGGNHTLAATATDAAGNTGQSVTVTVTVDNSGGVPVPPAGVAAVAPNGTRVHLSWSAAAGGDPPISYRILRDGSLAGQSSDTAYNDWTVAPGTTYQYQVVAVDAAGTSSAPSDPVAVTTPGPPAGFVFGAAGDHGANSRVAATLAVLDRSGPVFYVALGDLDYDETATDADWCTYVLAHLPTLGPSFPFEVVSGNHESDNGPNGSILNHAACLPDRLGSTLSPTNQYGAEYSFDYPAAEPLLRTILIVPDLRVGGVKYDYRLGTSRYQWLAATIDDARARGIPWVVVGMHEVCQTAGVKTCEIGPDLMNLLLDRRVDLVLQGHDHNYQRSRPLALDPVACPTLPVDSFDPGCVTGDATGPYPAGAGTVVVIGGTAGRSPRALNSGDPEAPFFAVLDGTHNGLSLVLVSVDRLQTRFVTNTGVVVDDVIIGAEAPGLSVDAGPADGATSPDPLPAYAGAAADPGGSVAGVLASVDGAPFSPAGIACDGCGTAAVTWVWTAPAPLVPGPHVVSFRAVDGGGHRSDTVSRRLDITAP